MKRVISLLVQNDPGVLSRVVGLISRRGFNISSLTVAPTNSESRSSITCVVDADEEVLDQITKQLNKLICVHKVRDLTDTDAIKRELVMFRVCVSAQKRGEVIQIANIFRANIVHVSPDNLIIEATGDSSKLQALSEMLMPYNVSEVIQSGLIALSRGHESDAR